MVLTCAVLRFVRSVGTVAPAVAVLGGRHAAAGGAREFGRRARRYDGRLLSVRLCVAGHRRQHGHRGDDGLRPRSVRRPPHGRTVTADRARARACVHDLPTARGTAGERKRQKDFFFSCRETREKKSRRIFDRESTANVRGKSWPSVSISRPRRHYTSISEHARALATTTTAKSSDVISSRRAAAGWPWGDVVVVVVAVASSAIATVAALARSRGGGTERARVGGQTP